MIKVNTPARKSIVASQLQAMVYPESDLEQDIEESQDEDSFFKEKPVHEKKKVV